MVHDSNIRFWSNWLLVVSIIFAVQALSWMLFGSFDPFGIYHDLLANSLLKTDGLSETEQAVFAFGAGLLGATTCAFFVLCAFIAHIPFRGMEKWAHVALSCGIFIWFVTDSLFSVAMNASFNVLVVNIPCLVIFSIPLLLSRKAFYRSDVVG